MDTLILAAEGPVNPVIPHTSEIILGLVAFLLLLFVIKKFVSPRFEALYEERTAKIEGGIEKAEQAQAEAQRALEQYKEQLAEARAEAARIRDDARAEGLQIVEEMREQAQAESARIVAQGQHQLDAQRAQIVAELRADLGRTAVELASKVVGESLEDDSRRRGTVDRFLNELDAVAAPASK
ncbi:MULTISPECIES: F0F1 ATP synthase subunit B [Lentzea]|jgi:F-type H+-transporting ATPase subunit b|uniref:ATP synthase subunit b n=1 Tax=Lentzea flaviverrucosa TaxID=200379 RepID=A0A1H9RLB5_9PSEU|nr:MULTISPECIES: F0F1 ATP synthase subunit B [Lentzea]MCR3753530.1 ATP synthase F0 subcomplex B subunit [Lentzea californiensis]RDI33059.1 ATP synthase F0 subcomplex B subunit [Lentzea flaviverrucosa]SER73566.1 F-type H+-transporting ATPase subunit b [Lentzea flaviverrucosa]